MSLLKNINAIALTPGVVSVYVRSEPGPADASGCRGLVEWMPMLHTALTLRAQADESELRVAVGTHTIFVQREGAEVAAVVVPKGHALTKSIHRLLRRMAKEAKPLTAKQRADALEQHNDEIADRGSF